MDEDDGERGEITWPSSQLVGSRAAQSGATISTCSAQMREYTSAPVPCGHLRPCPPPNSSQKRSFYMIGQSPWPSLGHILLIVRLSSSLFILWAPCTGLEHELGVLLRPWLLLCHCHSFSQNIDLSNQVPWFQKGMRAGREGWGRSRTFDKGCGLGHQGPTLPLNMILLWISSLENYEGGEMMGGPKICTSLSR